MPLLASTYLDIFPSNLAHSGWVTYWYWILICKVLVQVSAVVVHG